MFRSPFRPLAAAALALALASTGTTQAQTAAPKPAAKPAAKPATASNTDKTLGGGGAAPAANAASAPRKPILSRDELRACFADEAVIKDKLAKVEAERAPMDAEKQAIAADQAKFTDERVALDKRQRDATETLNTKFRGFATRVEASNARVAAFNAAKTSPSTSVERERVALNTERTALDKEREELEAEKVKVLAELQAAVDAYNTKAGSVDQRVAAWNQRNTKVNDMAGAVEAERKDWLANCSNRRYREEDEMAIKAGK